MLRGLCCERSVCRASPCGPRARKARQASPDGVCIRIVLIESLHALAHAETSSHPSHIWQQLCACILGRPTSPVHRRRAPPRRHTMRATMRLIAMAAALVVLAAPALGAEFSPSIVLTDTNILRNQ